MHVISEDNRLNYINCQFHSNQNSICFVDAFQWYMYSDYNCLKQLIYFKRVMYFSNLIHHKYMYYAFIIYETYWFLLDFLSTHSLLTQQSSITCNAWQSYPINSWKENPKDKKCHFLLKNWIILEFSHCTCYDLQHH